MNERKETIKITKIDDKKKVYRPKISKISPEITITMKQLIQVSLGPSLHSKMNLRRRCGRVEDKIYEYPQHTQKS
jgi:hypothetical protein